MTNTDESHDIGMFWANLYDSSWIARDLSQTMTSMDGADRLHQIGQLGITATIVIFGLLVVYLTDLYQEVKSDVRE